MFMIYSVKFGKHSYYLFEKELPTLLAICSFCGCLIVFVCFSLRCWGLDIDLIVSVHKFIFLPSRKHAYSNILNILQLKKENFQIKKF